MIKHKEDKIEKIFKLTTILKGLNALMQILGGLFFLFIRENTITKWIVSFAYGELLEDPKDYIA